MKHSSKLIAALTICSLLLLATSTEAKKTQPPPFQWYVKTTLELNHPSWSGPIRDTRSGVFGQLADSVPGWDQHDIPAFVAAQYSAAALVFAHGADWQDYAGEYLSDYRSAGTKKDAWEFSVHTTLTPQTATLRWEGLFDVRSTTWDEVVSFTEVRVDQHELLKNLHLVDLTTGKVIDVFVKGSKKKPEQWIRSYSFNMSGATRRDFRWVLGEVKKDHLKPFSALSGTASSTQSGNPGKTAKTSNLSSLQIQQLEAVLQGPPGNPLATPPDLRD